MDLSPIKEFEQQQFTKLKISAAIRLGCLMSAQTSEGVFKDNSGRTCALGAALLAIGHTDFARNDYSLGKLIMTWPELNAAIRAKIVEANDIGGKSREEIATWLEAQGL